MLYLYYDWTSTMYWSGGIWIFIGLTLLALENRGALIAYLLGPVTLLLFWGIHLSLSQDFFNRNLRWSPSLIEVISKAFIFGIIFIIAYLIFTAIESWYYSKRNKYTELPIRRLRAMLFGQIGVSVIVNLLGSELAYGLLGLFDAPLYTSIRHLRMDKPWDFYIPLAAMILYPFLGAILYSTLGFIIGYIEESFVTTNSDTSQETELSSKDQPPSSQHNA